MPDETPSPYIERMRNKVGDRDPMDILAETPGALREVAVARSPVQLRHRPFEGKWTPLEIIGHLVDHETVMAYRLRRAMFDEREASLESYPQEAWVAGQGHNDSDPQEFVAVFHVLRSDTLRLWRVAEQLGRLDRTFVHTARGAESLRTWRIVHAGHDLAHLDQISRYLAAT